MRAALLCSGHWTAPALERQRARFDALHRVHGPCAEQGADPSAHRIILAGIGVPLTLERQVVGVPRLLRTSPMNDVRGVAGILTHEDVPRRVEWFELSLRVEIDGQLIVHSESLDH